MNKLFALSLCLAVVACASNDPDPSSAGSEKNISPGLGRDDVQHGDTTVLGEPSPGRTLGADTIQTSN